MINKDRIRYLWTRFTRNFKRFTWGGTWAVTLSARNKQNLTLFFYDGLFSAASDKIILTYITIYLLSLGATRQQIGFLSSFSNFTAALLLLPAAMLVERTGARKKITVTSATGSRFVVLLMALLPFFLFPANTLVWVILALALLREALNYIGFPGWMALTADIVPIEGRGRYFGTRNLTMGVAGMIAALIIGELITQIGDPLGYQLAFILAAFFGVISISFFHALKTHRMKPTISTRSAAVSRRFFSPSRVTNPSSYFVFTRLFGIFQSVSRHHFSQFSWWIRSTSPLL